MLSYRKLIGPVINHEKALETDTARYTKIHGCKDILFKVRCKRKSVCPTASVPLPVPFA
jgi:hypothetical protein